MPVSWACRGELKLGVLNAGDAEDQAHAIADAVGYVIGMEGSIPDLSRLCSVLTRVLQGPGFMVGVWKELSTELGLHWA